MKSNMNTKNINSFDRGFLTVGFLAFLISVMFGNGTSVLAHGGEDHGEAKPKSTANAKGVVSHSARLGDLEVMVKHTVFEPDQATEGRVFVTRFDTNEPVKNAEARVEIESANGAVFAAVVEAGGQPGMYIVKFPALQAGSYKMRANVSYDGETDTATFSGIDVRPTASVAVGETSWLIKTVIGVVFFLAVALLCGLFYFVWRFAAGPKVSEEPLSA
jgi:hypothetical protein